MTWPTQHLTATPAEQEREEEQGQRRFILCSCLIALCVGISSTTTETHKSFTHSVEEEMRSLDVLAWLFAVSNYQRINLVKSFTAHPRKVAVSCFLLRRGRGRYPLVLRGCPYSFPLEISIPRLLIGISCWGRIGGHQLVKSSPEAS